jgi:beta-lactamase regulating signal transducer with metallopeptidase domain
LVLGLPWLVVIASSRQSAAQRHRVWVAGIVGALLLPLLTFFIPMQYSGPLGEAAAQWASQVSAPEGSAVTLRPTAPAPLTHGSPQVGAFFVLTVIWAAVCFLLFLRLAAGLRRLSQIASSSRLLNDHEWTSLVAELSEHLGVTRPVRVLLCRNPAFIPVTWGVFRPRVVLPSDATQWTEQRRRIVLAHELAHISRHDWLLQMCAEFMCCAYWFHPLAWVAARRLRQESEQACDDAVLNASIPASDYAHELLEIVQALGTASHKWAAALAIVRPSDLERRFEAMLRTSVNRDSVSKRARLLVACVALCLLVPLAAFRLPAQVAAGVAPRGWFLAGTDPGSYLVGIDREQTYQGHASAYLRSKPAGAKGFGTLMQGFSADQYLGQRVRLTASVKSEGVSGWAGLWMRVDQGATVISIDNMYDRPINGTTGWQEYSVVLDVPKDATGISFGVLLTGAGSIWLSDVKFETVGPDVPVTATPMPRIPAGPRNLDFEP